MFATLVVRHTVELVSLDGNKTPIALVLLRELVSLCSNNNNCILNGESREELFPRVGTILISPVGRRVCKFLLNYGSATALELEVKLKTVKATVSRILHELLKLGIIIVGGYIGGPYRPRSMRGPKVKIYLITDAPPEAAVDAQRRYGELKLIKATLTPELIRQSQLPEAIALCKTYMDDRGLKVVPDRVILMPMLQERGIKVNYTQLTTALHKSLHGR